MKAKHIGAIVLATGITAASAMGFYNLNIDEARKSANVVSNDVWVKCKQNHFYTSGNYPDFTWDDFLINYTLFRSYCGNKADKAQKEALKANLSGQFLSGIFDLESD